MSEQKRQEKRFHGKEKTPACARVLIVTYYWPPAGGPGVQRWLKFVKYLPEFGIQPVVYIPENPTYPIKDESLLSEVPEGLKTIKQPIFEPYRYASIFSKKDTQTLSSGLIAEERKQSFIQKMLLYIRGNFFIPDARKYWVKPSIDFLGDYISKEKINTVITTGPPHSLHLIGLGLKQKMGINWIADFRDPWTGMWYHDKLKLGKSAEKKHHELERKVLKTANQIIVTTFSAKKEFHKITEKPVEVITNGYDEGKEKEVVPIDEKFTVSHIGSFFAGKNLSVLWEVFSELIDENPSFKEKFRLQIIGKVNQEVLDSLSEFKLNDHVDLIGYVSHEKALSYQKKTQLLLLQYDNKEIKGIIPGKLFEYMQSRRPILALGPKGWDACKIILDTETGSCFDFSEKKGFKESLLQYFHEYQTGKLQIFPKETEKYHRRNLTGKLSEIIKALNKKTSTA